MSNFTFLPGPLDTITEASQTAEAYILPNPRSACFQSQRALEAIVHCMHRDDIPLSKSCRNNP